MNSLGQIKALLELQSLRNFSGQPTESGIPAVSSQFADFLQEFIQLQTSNQSRGYGNSPVNMLGQVYRQSQLHFQPSSAGGNNPYLNALQPVESTSSKIEVNDSSLEGIIQRAADRYQIPSKLIKSIIRHESNFNVRAVSGAGASGLMQLMPSTARWLGVTDIMDPEQNVMAGTKYIRNMLDKYNGSLKLALAAYNAGPGNVDKYGGIPPFKETQNYVQKVTGTYFG